MVALNEETTIASPADRVWPLLRDPAVVASCIPGAELAPDEGDGVWRGTIRVKFGPTAAVFRGEANLAFDDDERRIRIEGRGIDGRGASRALASGTVTARGDETTTTISVSGEFTVTGPLEGFASAGGLHVARALLAEFSANLANRVGERGGAAAIESDIEGSATPAPPTGALPTEAPPTEPTADPPSPADLVIGVGAGLGHYTTEGGYLYPGARAVQIDLHPRGLWQGLRTADLHIQADARAAAESIVGGSPSAASPGPASAGPRSRPASPPLRRTPGNSRCRPTRWIRARRSWSSTR